MKSARLIDHINYPIVYTNDHFSHTNAAFFLAQAALSALISQNHVRSLVFPSAERGIEAFEKLVSRASRCPDAHGTFSQHSIPKPESPNECRMTQIPMTKPKPGKGQVSAPGLGLVILHSDLVIHSGIRGFGDSELRPLKNLCHV